MMEKLNANWTMAQNPEEQKSLELKMLELAYGGTVEENKATLERLRILSAQLAAAETQEERKKLQKEIDNEMSTRDFRKLPVSVNFLFGIVDVIFLIALAGALFKFLQKIILGH